MLDTKCANKPSSRGNKLLRLISFLSAVMLALHAAAFPIYWGYGSLFILGIPDGFSQVGTVLGLTMLISAAVFCLSIQLYLESKVLLKTKFQFGIKTILLATVVAAALVALLVTLLPVNDSGFVRSVLELKGKTVYELRGLLVAYGRDYEVLLDLDSSGKSPRLYHWNGYLVRAKDGRVITLPIEPVLCSSDGMFQQQELDACKIRGCQIVGQKFSN